MLYNSENIFCITYAVNLFGLSYLTHSSLISVWYYPQWFNLNSVQFLTHSDLSWIVSGIQPTVV